MVFFNSPQPISLVLAFANDIKLGAEIDNLEIFPKSASRGKKGLSSSNMRLPLGIHRKYQGARSTFLNIDNYEPISLKETLDILRNVKFISHDTLQKAKSFLEIKYCTVLKQNQDIKVEEKTDLKGKNKDFIGLSGSILTLCPVLSELISKAKHDGHLLHHERLALATTLIHFEDGEKKIHEIMSYCSDYLEEETSRQINSIKGYWPYSCRRLQSIEFNLCSGWCCNQLKEKAEQGKSPSPISFAKLTKSQEEIKIDEEDVKKIERIASIENLYQAWNQAYMQAKERDIFEDVLAYEIFKDHLWANLHIIRSQLLKKQWKHKPFRVVMVPKKGEPNNARPMCYASPWDAIVALAVLNVIGPEIDSRFHRKSYGNRLAKGPKADGQIFEDWRKQNYLRELHREGFSYYDENHYYILTDITRFYEFVKHDKLLALLSRYIKEQEILYIIQQYIEAEWVSGGLNDNEKCKIGLPQGPALSAFLANLYLDELDSWLEDKCKDFVRYVDDLALLFESVESANNVFKELKQFLHVNFGLKINEDIDKTKGPFPISQKEHLIDWIRDIRYDIVKFTRNNKSLTLTEKHELHNALKYISGAKLEDRKDLERFIKYLGFYVANTEKLDQEDLNEGVYVLANFVLTEYRPKHNATCIAMRALVKSCIESDNANATNNFKRLKDILEKRKDEYIYLVFLRETRKWLEENRLDTEINPEIIKEIEECVSSPSFEISAEAIQCLIIISKISDACKSKLVEIFNSGRINIRARAGYLLGKTRNINSGDLARVVSSLIDGTEIAIAFKLINSKLITKPIIDELAIPTKTTNIFSEECLSYLLLASIVTGSEDGIIMCKNWYSITFRAVATCRSK